MKGCDFMEAKGKGIASKLGGVVVGVLADKAIEKAPEIIERISKKKEEKSFFEDNKSWIFMIILSIFVNNFNYINIFQNVILDSMVNIIFGILLLVLLLLFYYEEKNAFKINSNFIKTLMVSLVILGAINSLYHIGLAISNLFNFIL